MEAAQGLCRLWKLVAALRLRLCRKPARHRAGREAASASLRMLAGNTFKRLQALLWLPPLAHLLSDTLPAKFAGTEETYCRKPWANVWTVCTSIPASSHVRTVKQGSCHNSFVLLN